MFLVRLNNTKCLSKSAMLWVNPQQFTPKCAPNESIQYSIQIYSYALVYLIFQTDISRQLMSIHGCSCVVLFSCFQHTHQLETLQRHYIYLGICLHVIAVTVSRSDLLPRLKYLICEWFKHIKCCMGKNPCGCTRVHWKRASVTGLHLDLTVLWSPQLGWGDSNASASNSTHQGAAPANLELSMWSHLFDKGLRPVHTTLGKLHTHYNSVDSALEKRLQKLIHFKTLGLCSSMHSENWEFSKWYTVKKIQINKI